MRALRVLFIAPLLAACAGTAPPPGAASYYVRLAPGASRPDRVPELLSCSTHPRHAARRSYAMVTVKMLVKADGGVGNPVEVPVQARLRYSD